MHKISRKVKVAVKQLAVAFFFSTLIVFSTQVIIGAKVNKITTLINKLATAKTKIEKEENIKITLTTIEEKKRLSSYPYFGEIWATIEIPSVGIDLPVYHGDTLELIKYGAGHLAGSFFPGEGGFIVMDAHNTVGYFKELPNVNIGDNVIIKANYGTFTYSIYTTEIKEASILGQELTITDDEEILMLYTCYPTDTPGFKSKRFVAYAKLVGESYY